MIQGKAKSDKLQIPKGYSAAVLHTHTDHTDGMVSPKQLVQAAASKGIKVLAVTDHDTMSSFDEATKWGNELGVQIVQGEEIQTSIPRGIHIIGLFLKEVIPHSSSVRWTLEQIRGQGGITVVAHPMVRIFSRFSAPTAAMQMADLERLVLETSVDAVEIRHRFLTAADSIKLDEFYDRNEKKLGAKIGSSDSHFGSADMFSQYTLFPGETAKDLYVAIRDRKTITASGSDAKISFADRIRQNKKALFDVGLKRYGAFSSKNRILNS